MRLEKGARDLEIVGVTVIECDDDCPIRHFPVVERLDELGQRQRLEFRADDVDLLRETLR